METHPGKVTTESIPTIEIVGIELKKRFIKLVIGKPLDINLRGDEDEYSKNKRNEQTFESLTKILTRVPEFQGKS